MRKIIFLTIVIFAACTQVKEKVKDGLHKAGEASGEAIKQVSDGVSKAFEINVSLTDTLKIQGLKTGTTTLGWDSSATDNVLGVYFIFDKDLSKELMVKVFTPKNIEKGRTKVKVAGKKNDAKYIDIHFDKHVNIDADDKVMIEE